MRRGTVAGRVWGTVGGGGGVRLDRAVVVEEHLVLALQTVQRLVRGEGRGVSN